MRAEWRLAIYCHAGKICTNWRNHRTSPRDVQPGQDRSNEFHGAILLATSSSASHSMYPEGSLLCSHELADGPYPKSDGSSPHTLILFYHSIHSIISLKHFSRHTHEFPFLFCPNTWQGSQDSNLWNKSWLVFLQMAVYQRDTQTTYQQLSCRNLFMQTRPSQCVPYAMRNLHS